MVLMVNGSLAINLPIGRPDPLAAGASKNHDWHVETSESTVYFGRMTGLRIRFANRAP
jgi:hypothetical protein